MFIFYSTETSGNKRTNKMEPVHLDSFRKDSLNNI